MEHPLLLVRRAVRLDASSKKIVWPDEEVLDVVCVAAGHDSDAGVELRLQFQRRPLGFGGSALELSGVQLLLEHLPPELLTGPLGLLLFHPRFEKLPLDQLALHLGLEELALAMFRGGCCPPLVEFPRPLATEEAHDEEECKESRGQQN